MIESTTAADPGGLPKLLAGLLLSQLGFRLLALAMPLVAVVSLGASPLEVSVVAASQTVAFLLVGLPAGALVDRMRRLRVMIAADVVRALALVVVPLAWWWDALTVPLLCAVAFVVGVLTVFFDVANQSYLPRLVGRDRLVSANARLVTIDSAAGVAGPALGGLVVQLLTAPVAVLVTVGGYLASGAFVGAIRDTEPRPERPPTRDLRREIADGVRHIASDRLLAPIVACSASVTFAWSISYTMLLVLLAGELATPASLVGLVLTAGGLAALLVAPATPRIVRALGDGAAVRLSILVGAPFTLLAGLVDTGWQLWFAAVATGALTAALVIYNVAQLSFRQRTVPAPLLGRVNATFRFVAWGVRPLGALVGGLLAAAFSVRTAVWIGAVGTSLSFLWLYLSPLRGLRELPREANTDTMSGEPA